MKAKLRNILQTAWNEPRHFFFWLAMLSLCCFAAVALGLALVGPVLWLAFAALGCILCFLISIPAFILAWIPPVRRLLSWVLQRRYLVLGCLVTLVALFYAIENWRGRRAWQDFKREREAKGERFDLASLAPPPVPADQNFFETPLWSDLRFVATNGTVVWSETNHGDRVIFNAVGPKGNKAPSPGGWPKAEHADLVAWQAFYRGSNNVFAADQTAEETFRRRYGPEPAPPYSGPTTNYFPIAKEPQTPAADVLLALSSFETNRQLLIAAAARPQARFWVNYEAGYGMLLPHLARLKGSSQYLGLHATAALKAGDRATALEDVKLMFRLIKSIQLDPNLIAQLVRFSLLAIALQPVWEGLADRQWSDAELSVIEQELGRLDFLADCQLAMRGERACNVWAVDFIRKRGISELGEMVGSQREASERMEWEKTLGQAMFRLIPAGWFDQNKLSLCRVHEKYLLAMAAQEDRRVAPLAAMQQLDASFAKWRRRPYDMLTGILMPALGRVVEKSARAQSWADLARVACALERYRLANGQSPETLEALAPKFIAKLPHDVVNGQPLKYRRTEDSQFILYSVGRNETDDGGTLGLTKNGSPDWNKGDWVWHYPAR
jgi:hypothetical protein